MNDSSSSDEVMMTGISCSQLRCFITSSIEVFVAAAEDFGKDLLVHFRIVRDQDFGFDHSVDLIRILGRALL